MPQASTKAVMAMSVHLVATMMASAMRWGRQTSVGGIKPCRTIKFADAPTFAEKRQGGTHDGARVPGNDPSPPHSPSARRAVIKL